MAGGTRCVPGTTTRSRWRLVQVGTLAALVLAITGCGAGFATPRTSHTSQASTTTAGQTTAAATTARVATTTSPRIIDGTFYSPAVRGTLHYQIALPPGYATSGKRYPVLYVLHGLPASAEAYKGVAAIHHPGTYQVIESWSGYFVITDPDGNPLDLGSVEANADASAHASVPSLKRRFAPYGATFFGFYIGTKDPYTNFIADNKRLDRELTAAGIPHVFRLYPGAHDGTFWRMHQDQWLDGAVDRLDPPS